MVRHEQLPCMLSQKKSFDALTVVRERVEVTVGKIPNTAALLIIS